MNVRYVSRWCMVTALVVYGAGLGSHQAIAAEPGQAGVEDGVEVLTRGPVHEAFAGTVSFNPEPGIVVPKAPPEEIEELPPEQRLEGDNVAWISGYWAWDDERSDFLWVSGIWRNLPPGRQWVPGYWGQSGTDYQWTSGYWADATVSEVEYLPEPPASVEAGPNIPAPAADQNWLPGCWVWQQNRYAWRPGYWDAVQPDWVWVPAYYAWAPRGYVFVDGYWDYSVARRGILFAPVYFSSNIYSQRGYSYSPVTVINPAVFASQLFLRPNYQHYYFGDYYATSYSTAGYYPWFSYNSRHNGYDPIYAHQSWQHRQDHEWEHHVQADFQHRRDHEEARPPRTWAAQQTLVANQVNSTSNSFVIAAPLAQLVKSTTSPLRFQAVAQEERQTLVRHGHEMQDFRRERQQLEANAAVTSAADPSPKHEPISVKLPMSPIVARSADQFGQDQAPPQRHEVLKPDLQIEPKPRGPGQGKPLPLVPGQVNPERPAQGNPERPAQANPERPAQVNPERPAQVNPERPAQANPERPAQVKPERPAQGRPEQPAQGRPEQPAQGRPEQPAQGNPERPAQVNPERPAQPNPERPAQANPERPAQANPERPAQAKPERPAQFNRERPAQFNPERPAQARPERPAQFNPERPAQVRPERPAQVRPEEPKPTKGNQPNSNRRELPAPTLNRPSEQPRPQTTNRLPRGAERPQPAAQPPTDSPRAGADPPGPTFPTVGGPPQPKVERPAPAQPSPQAQKPPKQGQGKGKK